MHAKVGVGVVADELGRKSSAPERFESGQTWPAAELELYAAAYAKVAGIDDPRTIYQMSLESWIRDGDKPLTAPALAELDEREDSEPAFRDLIESIRRAGALERARVEAERRPNATRKKRKGEE